MNSTMVDASAGPARVNPAHARENVDNLVVKEIHNRLI
jgi:hypothetical protein